MRKIFLSLLLVGMISLPNFVLAVTPSSESFSITGGEVVPTAGSGSSENFQVNLSSGSETGNPSSESFSVTGGSSVPQSSTSNNGTTETVGTNGGGASNVFGNGETINLLDVKIFNLSTSSAKISFVTDNLAVSYLRFGENTNLNLETGKEDSYLLNHSFVLSGLKVSTNYNFVIYLIDRDRNEIFSQVFSFKTLPVINLIDGDNTEEETVIVISKKDEQKVFIPVKINNIDSNLKPVEVIDSLEYKYSNIFDFYSIAPQYVDKNFVDLSENFKNLPKDVVDSVNTIKPNLINQFGVLQQNIYENLSSEEKKAIEEIIGFVLPLEAKVERVISTSGDRKELAKNFGADWYSLPGSQLFISLESDLVAKDIVEITVNIENESYPLLKNEETGNYEGLINVPNNSAKYEVLSRIIYEDNTYEEIHNSLFVDNYGYVYNSESANWSWSKLWKFLTKTKLPLSNTKIVLEQKNSDGTWSIWSEHSDDVYNPVFTDEFGRFAFFVDNGTYRLHVYSDKYGDYFSEDYQVDRGIFNFDIEVYSSNNNLLFFSFTLLAICGIIFMKFFVLKKL